MTPYYDISVKGLKKAFKIQDVLKNYGDQMKQTELEYVIEKYGRDIYSFCCYLTKSRQEADDLYQDTFLKIMESPKLQSGYDDMKNMLLSVSVNLWKDKKRKFAWRKKIEEEKYLPQAQLDISPEYSDQLEERIIRNEDGAFVRKCVAALPEKMKIVVLLYYMENRKMAEISELLGIPEGTVKSRLHQAKALLFRKLTESTGEEVIAR